MGESIDAGQLFLAGLLSMGVSTEYGAVGGWITFTILMALIMLNEMIQAHQEYLKPKEHNGK